MSLDGPLEIFGASSGRVLHICIDVLIFGLFLVDKPSGATTFTSVRETLKRVVPLCLESDPSLIPASCKADLLSYKGESSSREPLDSEQDPDDRDPDDFTFWSERQAKRILAAIKQIFDVDYAPEVIVADANLTTLSNRILAYTELLGQRGNPDKWTFVP